ncbi:MAG TPA: outer membrane protein assembly factor BamE [Anaerolineae bacterium]|nr:outer membrane protein assembly factor BamE [Anaerolineae bacterium]
MTSSNKQNPNLTYPLTSYTLGLLLALALLFLGLQNPVTTPLGQRLLLATTTLLLTLYLLPPLYHRQRPTLTSFLLYLRQVAFAFASLTLLLLTLALLTFDTEYAPTYTHRAFRQIELGMTTTQVEALIGPPLTTANLQPFTTWLYTMDEQPDYAQTGTPTGSFYQFHFDHNGQLTNGFGQQLNHHGGLVFADGVNPLELNRDDLNALLGATTAQIKAQFNQPNHIFTSTVTQYALYSRSPSDTHYHRRTVGYDEHGRVVRIINEIYWD